MANPEGRELVRIIKHGIERGVANALREHKRAGRSIVVERDGKIVAIPPHKIRVPRAG